MNEDRIRAQIIEMLQSLSELDEHYRANKNKRFTPVEIQIAKKELTKVLQMLGVGAYTEQGVRMSEVARKVGWGVEDEIKFLNNLGKQSTLAISKMTKRTLFGRYLEGLEKRHDCPFDVEQIKAHVEKLKATR